MIIIRSIVCEPSVVRVIIIRSIVCEQCVVLSAVTVALWRAWVSNLEVGAVVEGPQNHVAPQQLLQAGPACIVWKAIGKHVIAVDLKPCLRTLALTGAAQQGHPGRGPQLVA